DEYLARIGEFSAPVLEMTKTVIQSSLGMPLKDAMKKSQDIYLNQLMALEDVQEWIRAVLGKTKPLWKNKQLKRIRQLAHDVVAVDVLVRRFAGGVVPAGQDHGLVVEAAFFESFRYFARELFQKCQIVLRVDEQDLFLLGGEFFEVRHRADRQPRLAK